MNVYRLGWKGILYNSDAWLYLQPDVPGLLLLLLMVALYLPSLFLSYLKVSSSGMELHYWPYYRVFVRWDEIDRIGLCRALLVFPCEALYLNKAEAKEKNATIREWGLVKQCIVPLSDFRTWPDGELKRDLQRYIPHIFS
jgi:hypothetical protein